MNFLNKFSVITIIKKHHQTFHVTGSKSINFIELGLFYILILFLTGILLFFKIFPSDNTLKSLLTIFSIFTPLLFNLLFSCSHFKNETNFSEKKHKELLSNISFNILLSIMIICLIIFKVFNIHSIFLKFECLKNYISLLKTTYIFLIYFLSLDFFFTLFLILKRTHYILLESTNNDFDIIKPQTNNKNTKKALD